MLIGFGYKHTFMHYNDLQLIREAYVNNSDVFSNRPALINPMQEREKGLIMRNGRDWKMIRRFTLKTLTLYFPTVDVGRRSMSVDARILPGVDVEIFILKCLITQLIIIRILNHKQILIDNLFLYYNK